MSWRTVKDDAHGGVEPSEELGRCVLSSHNARRSSRGSVPHNVFLERPGSDISVERLSVAPDAEALDHARNVATQRGTGKKFYGWAVVTAELAALSERQVLATPQKDNPYHADIVLPDSARDERDEQIRHAQELADASRWQPAKLPPRRGARFASNGPASSDVTRP